VAIWWLALSLAEGTYPQALEYGIDPADEAVYLKRVDHSQLRFLAAIKTPAQVRQGDPPAMQTNVVDAELTIAVRARF
jgi:hypothetical protein